MLWWPTPQNMALGGHLGHQLWDLKIQIPGGVQKSYTFNWGFLLKCAQFDALVVNSPNHGLDGHLEHQPWNPKIQIQGGVQKSYAFN